MDVDTEAGAEVERRPVLDDSVGRHLPTEWDVRRTQTIIFLWFFDNSCSSKKN
jgi:hypothetical protein